MLSLGLFDVAKLNFEGAGVVKRKPSGGKLGKRRIGVTAEV